MTAVVALRDAGVGCGTKARTLGRLLSAGLVVPDGVVVPDPGAPGWRDELPDRLRALGGGTFAVRSSAAAEDSADASWAGQLRTLLGVPADQVDQAVREVATTDARGAAYAIALGVPRPDGVAVLVQPMLTPVAAGVAFTRHPVTGEGTTVVEVVPGLGDRLVSGEEEPERWFSGIDGSVRLDAGRGVLVAHQARAVAAVAEHVERVLGGPQDVEWAIDAGGLVQTLQARPVTARGVAVPRLTDVGSGALLGVGTPAAAGAARGRVRVLRSLDDLNSFRPGDVLVCRATSPAWTPVLARAAAVVTEVGGVLSHAAIVARELGVPAVTGVAGAREMPDGALVVVDGSVGTVRAVTAS